ncbi:MAG: hypothetical protein JO072_16390 [Parafilimonas sp.]|nr:hypothetical protein [Parafilimonas sp.]
MNYQTEFIIIRLPLAKGKSFQHTPDFNRDEYAQQNKITLFGDPISIQVEKNEIILVYKGYPYEDNRPPMGFIQR